LKYLEKCNENILEFPLSKTPDRKISEMVVIDLP